MLKKGSDVRSDRYTFLFAAAVCIVCSVLLAVAASSLKPLQEFNVSIDRKTNILKALGLYDQKSGQLPAYEIEKIFSQRIMEKAMDAMGNEVAIDLRGEKREGGYLPYYVRSDNNSIAIPIEGMGLWSLLQGYLALESDGRTVKGLTFYEHKETPGLGAEIEEDWFTGNFVGKDILNKAGELVSITAVRGKAGEYAGQDLDNLVDGISGASMTVRGVNDLLLAGLKDYEQYLKRLWKDR
ncbi:FMN-binding protein [Fibrobacterota bacterium]